MNQLAVPLILAGVTAVGLLAALLGGDRWQPMSWLALAIPIAVILERLVRGLRRR